MSLTISQEIMAAKFRNMKLGFPEPRKILLGKKEIEKLKTLARELETLNENFLEYYFPGEGESRLEYQGLKVYVVDDEAYCEAAP